MEQMDKRELMSALADGQLRGEAFAAGVEIASGDASAREAWRTYHLIGDVLRSPDLAAGTPPAEFLGKLQARLAHEERLELAVAPVTLVAREAANDGLFRWKMAAGVASLAAVGAIGWSVLVAAGPSGPAGVTAGAQVAAAPAGTVLVGSAGGVVIRDARLEEMLAAHRQLAGATALQQPQGFLRNATFDNPSR